MPTDQKIIENVQNTLNQLNIKDECIGYQRKGGIIITRIHGEIKYKIFKRFLNGMALECVNYYDNIFDSNTHDLKKEVKNKIRSYASSYAAKKGIEKNGEKIIRNLLNYNKIHGHPLQGKKRPGTTWSKGLTKNTDKRLANISKRMEENNPTHTQKYKENSDKIKEKQSRTIKRKILNGEFKPKLNCWNNSLIEWKGRKYRSSWEAAFHYLNSGCEYEKLRIPYYDTEKGKERVFIVDFIDVCKKIVYEIKPTENSSTQNMKDKLKFLDAWCEDNGYTFVLITQKYFKDNLTQEDILNFPETIQRKLKGIRNR